jgi:hypothetical protein
MVQEIDPRLWLQLAGAVSKNVPREKPRLIEYSSTFSRMLLLLDHHDLKLPWSKKNV